MVAVPLTFSKNWTPQRPLGNVSLSSRLDPASHKAPVYSLRLASQRHPRQHFSKIRCRGSISNPSRSLILVYHVLDVKEIEGIIPSRYGSDATEIPGSRALLEAL